MTDLQLMKCCLCTYDEILSALVQMEYRGEITEINNFYMITSNFDQGFKKPSTTQFMVFKME